MTETQPITPDTSISMVDRLQDWRERILRILLFVMPGVGTVMLAVNARIFIESGYWAVLGFAVIAYLYVIIVTLLGKRISYLFRAASVIFVAYALAPLSYTLYGLSGDGRVWLVFFVLFTTLMVGMRAGIIATLISVVTHLGFGLVFSSGYIPDAIEEASGSTPFFSSWVSTGVTVLFVVLVLFISMGILLRGLDQSLKELNDTLQSERQLTHQLSEEHGSLNRRSQDLERRVAQIRLAAEISGSLGTILDPQELIQNLVNRLKSGFDLYYAGVFLADDNTRYAVLTAGTGEAGKNMIAEGHKLSIGGSSMVGWAMAHRQPRIALDVGQEAIRFKNPHLPLTRSELALPLAIGNQVIGALTVQSVESQAFDDDDITVLQSIADSLAIALENARLFQQFEDSLREIQQLNRQYLGEAWRDISEEERGFSVVNESGLSTVDGSDAFELNVPLTLRDEQVIGNITLESNHADWSSDELEFIEAVSNQAALALESARLLDETQKRVEREQALNRLTAQFSQSLDFDSLIKTVVRELGQLPNVTEASIHIAPQDGLEEDLPSLTGEPE